MEATRFGLEFQAGTPLRLATCGAWISWDAGAPGPGDLLGAAIAMKTSADAGAIVYDSIAPDDYEYSAWTAQNFETVAVPVTPTYPYGLRWEPTTVQFRSGPMTPTIGNPSPSPAIAQVVSCLTALPGRRRRGRVYLPPPSETQLGPDGAIPAVEATQAADFWEQVILAGIAFAPAVYGEHVIASLAAEAAGAAGLPHQAGVITYVGRTSAGTQRRRQAYSG